MGSEAQLWIICRNMEVDVLGCLGAFGDKRYECGEADICDK